jgi:hypothetical protein
MGLFGRSVNQFVPYHCPKTGEWVSVRVYQQPNENVLRKAREIQDRCNQSEGECPGDCEIRNFLNSYGSGSVERG